MYPRLSLNFLITNLKTCSIWILLVLDSCVYVYIYIVEEYISRYLKDDLQRYIFIYIYLNYGCIYIYVFVSI